MFAKRPIPIVEKHRYAGSYHPIAIDQQHPLHKEPLVLLSDYGIAAQSYHARSDGGNAPYFAPVPGSRVDVWNRKTIALMLGQVNEVLRQYDLEVLVLDGYRPIACQQGLWDFFLNQARQQSPQADDQEHQRLAAQHVVNPANFSPEDARTWPAHSGGAAVDITMRHLRTGKWVDMGAQFEHICPESEAHYYEKQREQGCISDDDPRLIHRRLLFHAMHQVGFINDPFVFWHYDWGNQLYIKMARKLFGSPLTKAWYGYIEAPPAIEK